MMKLLPAVMVVLALSVAPASAGTLGSPVWSQDQTTGQIGLRFGPNQFAPTAILDPTSHQVSPLFNGQTPADFLGQQGGVVLVTTRGAKCDGTTDDGPAILAADAAAKSLGATLYFPQGKTCRVATGFLINTPHTHWTSLGVTTIKIDGAATTVLNAENQAATINIADTSDLQLTGITFNGAGAATKACATPCATPPRVLMTNVSGVKITGGGFQNFGSTQVVNGSPTYIQGLLVIGGSDYDIASSFVNNSGDGLAFSNGPKHVNIHNSVATGNADSAFVCTIGGVDFRVRDSVAVAPGNNAGPIIVSDRCQNVYIQNNEISGGASGNQGVRIARYGDTTDVNQDISITGNNLPSIGGTAISVEAAATKQGANGTATGGGRFTVANNVVGLSSACINVSDSEVGSVVGNTCNGQSTDGIDIVAYTAGVNTGAIIVDGNTIIGGSRGIRQLAAGGSLTPSTFGTNHILGATVPTTFVSGMAQSGGSAQPMDNCTPVPTTVTPQNGSFGTPAPTAMACAVSNGLGTYIKTTVVFGTGSTGTATGGVIVSLPVTTTIANNILGQDDTTGGVLLGRTSVNQNILLISTMSLGSPAVDGHTLEVSGVVR